MLEGSQTGSNGEHKVNSALKDDKGWATPVNCRKAYAFHGALPADTGATSEAGTNVNQSGQRRRQPPHQDIKELSANLASEPSIAIVLRLARTCCKGLQSLAAPMTRFSAKCLSLVGANKQSIKTAPCESDVLSCLYSGPGA